ncbi:MAG TPA: alpha/beta fold hydrolase [Thermoanaerobaculia bacterium]|nr:alpha/beta fold hydrolase [Thermoanaerobaculia bacterium]
MKRAITRGLVAAGAAAGAVELLAWVSMWRDHAERSHLGDLLYTEEYGAGEPVLFIPGLQASTRYWGDMRPMAAGGRRLLLVDLLGFGRSPWPMDSSYSLDDHIAWLRRTVVSRGAGRGLTIVAHSFGTVVAAHYAARYADDVKRVFLLGAPLYDSAAEARQRIRDMSTIAALFSLNRFLAREGCMVVCAFRPLVGKLAILARPDLPPEVAHDAVLHHWPSIRGAIDILLHTPLTAALPRIGPKTVFVHGTEDTVTMVERTRDVAAAAGARFVEIPGRHHDYQGVLPSLLAEEI